MLDIGLPRWWPLTGILGLVLIGVGTLLPGFPPAAGASAKDVAAYYTANPQAVQQGTYLAGLGGILWLWFAVAFYWVLRKTEGHAVWSLSYFAGSIVLGAVSTIGLIPAIVLSQPSITTALPELVLALNSFVLASGAIAGFSGALLTLSASVLIIRSGIIAKWIGWLGALATLLELGAASGLYVARGPFAANGIETLVALGIFSSWTIAIAVALMIKQNPAPAL